MATINATINVNSDIMSYPISINKTMRMTKAGTSTGLDKTLGLSYEKFNATTAVVLELAADATASKASKVYIRNTGSSKSNYFYVALNASAAAATTTETIGKLYGGDWMLIPWEANGTAHNITVAPSTADTMTLEWMAFVE
tara:strand:+ start:954 stop:1376 length:423 start_codon:yes stop_codon:yes gene_type:complete